jgi:hypothetical protein
MLALPRAGQSREDARKELLSLIEDPLTVVLIARGSDEGTSRFVNRAEILARLRRRVVHVRDPRVLEANEEATWFADDGGEAVIGAVLVATDGRCGRVLQRRQSRVNIELAFLQCEARL